MKIIFKTKLKIRDQHELLNQIAGTYKDFFRAAMEYIDNAVDAASIKKESGVTLKALLEIHVDINGKKVSFIDNCGGMSPQELCELLSEVGRSKKKTVPWANGQFGFGVHAFRAFAKEAIFISRKKGHQEAKIKIDRTFDENVSVPCEESDGKQLEKPGTMVTISKFDPQVFKKQIFVKSLVSEIERHFDDVLRSKLIKIIVSDGSSKHYECQSFNYSHLAGVSVKKEISIPNNGSKKTVNVDLKILERLQENHLPVLTNKQRRIQNICDLKSYKNYAREQGKDISVWGNPFIVGSIEINDICSPNLTRDDLKDSPAREALYGKIFEIQNEVEALVDKIMNDKSQESFQKLSNVMSDCLSRIMRSFRLQYEIQVPSSSPGVFEKKMAEGEGDVPFGGEGAGGGGTSPDEQNSGDGQPLEGSSGVGKENYGGGSGPLDKTAGIGKSKDQLLQAPGPRIEFQNHAGADRIIDLGNSLIINTQHTDFIKRNSSKSGKIKLDNRLLNYVSLVITPPCIHRLFEKKGKVPTALEVGSNVIDLGLRLEQELVSTVLNEEIERTLE
ncbi:MAG: ATP-binding protein [Candidatus Omnitrophica bacterium]|nr:ATP-binding protein [Candidatus Omnitrophota bacterium]